MYRDVLLQRCNLERETLKNALAIATQAPDEFAYNLKKGPRYMDTVELNMYHRGTETVLSLTDAESKEPTSFKQRSTCEENQEELNVKLSSEDNHQSDSKKTTQTAFMRNIIESKELLQFRKNNIAYFIASDGSPCDKGSRVLIEKVHMYFWNT